MNDRQKERLQELANEATGLLTQVAGPMFLSDAYLRIKQKVAEECGEQIFDELVAIIWKSRPIPVSDEDAKSNLHLPAAVGKEIISAQDAKTAHDDFKISLSPNDLKDIERAFEAARREDQAPLLLPTPSVELKILSDPRTQEQVVDSIYESAHKLNLDARLFFARKLNAAYGELVPYFPENEQLADDAFWRSKIGELILSLSSLQESKTALLNLELLLKKIYESQVGGEGK